MGKREKIAIAFLQGFIILVSIAALVFLLWEPQIEGRNVNASLYDIYFKDFFLACVYVASIAFFTALWKASKLLSNIREGKTFTQDSVKAFRIIRYCASILAIFVFSGLMTLFIARPGDDIAGGVAMGLVVMVVSILVAVSSYVFERLVKNGIKSGNF